MSTTRHDRPGAHRRAHPGVPQGAQPGLHAAQHQAPPARSARIGSWTWADPVVRAWVFVALIPVFALLAYGVAVGVYTLLGYQVGVDDAPLWVDRLTGLAGFVTVAVPCALAIRYGNKARLGADRRGVAPLAVGLLVGVWWLATGVFALAGTF